MEIHIKTIPNGSQRYPTVGDYWYDDEGILQVRVSDMKNKKYEMLVVLHELIEQFLTEETGITEQQITDFDLYFEKKREMGMVAQDAEPGFATDAPYRKQHTIATGVEMMLAAELEVDWEEYDRAVMSL